MEQIVEHGHVRRGRIGVSIKDLTPAVEATPAGIMDGAVITDVSRGSPAEHGGIQKGDVVVAADGAPIRSAARLRNKLGLTPVGQRVQLTVRRKGDVHNVSVEVAPASSASDATATISESRRQHSRADDVRRDALGAAGSRERYLAR
jgi:S1-C subfamily serine protease